MTFKNAISWFEIPSAADINRAQEFYQYELFLVSI